MSINKSMPGSDNRALARSAGVIAFATFCSRILGFIRDVVIARLFGVYVYAQAFVVAFRIPNLLRDLVGEGAANAAFVPVFSGYSLKHTREEFWELINVVLNLLLITLSAITVLGVIFSPFIVRLIAPGFIADPEKLAVTVRLSRIIFPYILLIGLAAYAMAVLNSLKHFSVPAFAPCLLNISIIVFALLFGEGIKGLSLGVLVGGLAQLCIQIPVLYLKGFRLELFRRFRHPEARTIGRLMLPRLFSFSVYQLNNFVDSIFGSLAAIVGEGGVAALYFAYRLILFPIGIFSNSLSQAILPTFSTQALKEDQRELKQTLSFGLRAVFLVMLPASVAFMVLSEPLVRVLFEHGRFDYYSTRMTADALFFYSFGLFAYASVKILQSCFFALKDTATPAKVSFIALIINIALNAILMFPLKLSGLALATSISGISAFVILFAFLKKKIRGFPTEALALSFIRILLASILMGAVCAIVSRNLVLGYGFLARMLNLIITIACGALSYLVFCFLLKVSEVRELITWLVKKKF